MRLHSALDYNLNLRDAFRIIDAAREWVDVFETGTPFLRENYNLEAVRAIRKAYPDIVLYVDTKTRRVEDMQVRNGSFTGIKGTPYEVIAQAYEAGGDIATVVDQGDDEIIAECVRAARDYGKEILADLKDMDSAEDNISRAIRLDELGVDYVSANTVYVNRTPDQVPDYYKPLEDLKLIMPYLKHARASIQGGVDLTNIAAIAAQKPDLICVGRGIYAAEDPGAAAKAFKEAILAAE